MAEVSALVEGGKATAGAPLGPALGPLGVNIGEVVSRINEKTKGYAGMKVPVTIEVHRDKTYDIKVGSPPTSSLIVKELNAKKGGSNQKTDTVGNLSMEQVKKLAEMKLDSLASTKLYSAASEIIGTCNSMAVTVEGKRAKEIQGEFREGRWDSFFGKEARAEKGIESLSSEVGKEVQHLREEAKDALYKAEHAVEEAVEDVREAIHRATGPKPKTGKPKKESVKEAPPEIKEEVSDAEEQAEALEEELPEKKTSPSEGAPKEENPEKPGAAKESYTRHMEKVEEEAGLKKRKSGKETRPKSVETETIKSDSTEIVRPKKKPLQNNL